MQNDRDKPLYAGGCLLLIGFLVGAVTGIATGQPSLGSIVGVAVAAVIALLLWMNARRQRD